ncbi:hypothetical protein BK138_33830 [Paenibacillus rhizosphaerae]|uniref:YdbS-like PH domain-containing protein n=1 Tax=Paenibacillus rhizosphaerae TaxID=297318 RepID=A0A1R1E179_9BACL|nr:PH domain-containing protein [Paenibacillus rhizosphaerae]OMF45568.1 hypothetical protein BK138_33830 [Paenibacillus rhizosphaerae]
MKRIDPRAVKARRMEGWIASAISVVLIIALLWLTMAYSWPVWIAGWSAAAVLLFIVLELAVLPGLLYRYWRYEITEKNVELNHGVWVRRKTLIPMVRIQHVDSKQGPIQKIYGLSTVTFSTAAGSHRIPALSEQEAENIRKQISDWAGGTDGEL